MFRFIYFIYVSECLHGMYIYGECECWCHWRSEERSNPETAVMNGCGTPCGYWEINPDPLRRQVHWAAEPSLQSHTSHPLHNKWTLWRPWSSSLMLCTYSNDLGIMGSILFTNPSTCMLHLISVTSPRESLLF